MERDLGVEAKRGMLHVFYLEELLGHRLFVLRSGMLWNQPGQRADLRRCYELGAPTSFTLHISLLSMASTLAATVGNTVVPSPLIGDTNIYDRPLARQSLPSRTGQCTQCINVFHERHCIELQDGAGALCFAVTFGYARLLRTCTVNIMKNDLSSDPPAMTLTVINKGPFTEDCCAPLFDAYHHIVTESDDELLFITKYLNVFG